jgi:hypothetical protein
VFVVCLAGSVQAAGEYRTIEVESLRITVDSEWATRNAPGYLPVRFDITNLGEARIIEIVGVSSRFFRAPRPSRAGGAEVRQTLRLARGDRVRLTIPVPIYADNESIRFELREEGRAIERFAFASYQSKASPAEASLLIVADPSSPLGHIATDLRSRRGPTAVTVPGGRPSSLPVGDFVLEPARLPATWLGFTALRAVLIGSREWEQLNDAQKSAVLSWTAAGGDLLLVDGGLDTLFPPDQALRDPGTGQSVRAYFFGRIHLLTTAALNAAGLDEVLKRADGARDPSFALPAGGSSDWGVIAGRGFRLLIPGIEGVPARAYLSILIVFTLLIGPVNYWFLWRKRRQVLLVLTAPVISVAFILLLAVYVVAGEGLSVYGRAASFTMLDEVRKQAVTRVSASLYAAGMTPGDGLRFGRDVAVFQIGRDGAGNRDRYVLDLTEAQRYSEGIIQARSPTNFEQIIFRQARERLSFSRESDGHLAVVNGLGAPVARLLYRVGGTRYKLSTSLAPGDKGLLETVARADWETVPSDVPLSARFRYLIDNQPEGSYLAVLETSPFWEPGTDLVERGSFHLVIGWPEGQP